MRLRLLACAPLVGVLLLATPCLGDDAPSPARLQRAWREQRLEGGVAVGFSTETWSRSMYGYGPRFDVGLGVGDQLAVVVGEFARFAFGSSESLRMMSFGVQAGIVYGAPYQTRTGLGAAILVGPERPSTSTTEEALVAWGVTGSLGVRASVATGPLDLWIGFDGVARSESIRVGRPDPYGVGSLSMLLSMGCFFPAMSGQMITASR
jgi:hypothetical protein